jgi:glutamate carboxypeptidase
MRIKLNLLLGLLCVFAVTKAYCAPLSSEEARLRDHVTKRYQADLKLLQSLVNINSGTSNIAGVYRVGRVIERQLRRLGFKTSWVNEPVNMRRAGTLVAERVGTQGKKLLLIGHLDTVFPKNSPFQRAILKKNSMKGPGVLDDKGGVLVMLSALNALASIHALDHTSIIVVLTGDEEDAGKPINVSRKPLFAAAKRSDVALDFEPAITLDTISIARRGVASWSIESHGNESHSATIFIPEVGDGAIFELARILNTMRAEFKGEENLTYNPGIILGGNVLQFDKKASKGSAFGKDNIVAKVSLAHGDYRFLTTEQKKSFEARLTKIVSDHLPGTHSSV